MNLGNLMVDLATNKLVVDDWFRQGRRARSTPQGAQLFLASRGHRRAAANRAVPADRSLRAVPTAPTSAAEVQHQEVSPRRSSKTVTYGAPLSPSTISLRRAPRTIRGRKGERTWMLEIFELIHEAVRGPRTAHPDTLLEESCKEERRS
jgi:hypothetical protein